MTVFIDLRMAPSMITGTRVRVAVALAGDGQAEVRHTNEVSAQDEVIIDFGRQSGPSAASILLGVAKSARAITWLRVEHDNWFLNGDELRSFCPDRLGWLRGWHRANPAYTKLNRLRNGEEEGHVSIVVTPAEWIADRPPWEPGWRYSDGRTFSGGNATVRRVVHEDGRVGALKVLHDRQQSLRERRQRFVREVGALQFNDGNGTPRLLESNIEDAGDLNVTLYCITEWIEGRTLQAAVQQRLFSFDEARRVIHALAAILAPFHGDGDAHRDLHPNNVLLRPDDSVVLLDFGMTTWEHENDALTVDGQELGNRFFRLPEFAPNMHCEPVVADVTLLVGLLFFMITGVYPRMLADPLGRAPHERLPAEVVPRLTRDRRWPRILRLFDRTFVPNVSERIPTLDALERALARVDRPLPQDVEGAMKELATVIASNEWLQAAERVNAVLQQVVNDVVSFVTDELRGLPLIVSQSPRLAPGGRTYEITLDIASKYSPYPTVQAQLVCSHGSPGWRASYRLGTLQTVEFPSQPEEAGFRACVQILQDQFLRDIVGVLLESSESEIRQTGNSTYSRDAIRWAWSSRARGTFGIWPSLTTVASRSTVSTLT